MPSRFIFIGILMLFLCSFTSAQVIGEIFTAEEADSLFGDVMESIDIPTTEVERYLDICGDKIMFRLENGVLHVLDEHRNILASDQEYIDEQVVFKVYSRSRVEELILKGGMDICTFENRKTVFSVTNGGTTMEKSIPCPPYCNYGNISHYSIHID